MKPILVEAMQHGCDLDEVCDWANDAEPGLYLIKPERLPEIPDGYRLVTEEDRKHKKPDTARYLAYGQFFQPFANEWPANLCIVPEDWVPGFPRWTKFQSTTLVVIRRWDNEIENCGLCPEEYSHQIRNRTYFEYVALPEAAEITETEAKRLIAEAEKVTPPICLCGKQTQIIELSREKCRCRCDCGRSGAWCDTKDAAVLTFPAKRR